MFLIILAAVFLNPWVCGFWNNSETSPASGMTALSAGKCHLFWSQSPVRLFHIKDEQSCMWILSRQNTASWAIHCLESQEKSQSKQCAVKKGAQLSAILFVKISVCSCPSMTPSQTFLMFAKTLIATSRNKLSLCYRCRSTQQMHDCVAWAQQRRRSKPNSCNTQALDHLTASAPFPQEDTVCHRPKLVQMGIMAHSQQLTHKIADRHSMR